MPNVNSVRSLGKKRIQCHLEVEVSVLGDCNMRDVGVISHRFDDVRCCCKSF